MANLCQIRWLTAKSTSFSGEMTTKKYIFLVKTTRLGETLRVFMAASWPFHGSQEAAARAAEEERASAEAAKAFAAEMPRGDFRWNQVHRINGD